MPGRDERTVVILYHKPKGVITSHSNEDSVPSSSSESKRNTVYDDVMSMKGYNMSRNDTLTMSKSLSFKEATGIKSKLHAVGRLDAETTGLLLLTNDGGLVHHVTNPTAASSSSAVEKKKIVKIYDALIMGYHTLDEDEGSRDHCTAKRDTDVKGGGTISSTSTQLRKLFNGVDIGKKYGGMTLPPQDLQVLSHPTAKTTLVRIAISEGKNRQVRRMFHAINSGVMQLHRRQVGKLGLDMLHAEGEDDGTREGSWRVLSDREVLDGLGWKPRLLSPCKQESARNDGWTKKRKHRSRR